MCQELNKETIIKIMNELKEKRPIFCSEADFQFALAGCLKEYLTKEKYQNVNIFLEYYQFYSDEGKPMHIDILVAIGKDWYPIELKYKTKGNYDINKNLKYKDEQYEFYIKNQLAQNISCYKYLYDINRIEKIKKNAFQFKRGYAIMLTNDSCYWNGPQEENCVYTDFLIKEGSIIPSQTKLDWRPGTSDGIKNSCKPFTLIDKYEMRWLPYSNIPKDKLEGYKGKDKNSVCQFKYLISEIKSNNN